MAYNPKKHHRRSIRLPGYDYTSSGAYFVTICVRGGECLLGKVVKEEMCLNNLGQIAHDFWTQVPVHFPGVSIDTFTVMPNHLHAVIVIQATSKVVGEGEEGEGEEGEETSPLQGFNQDVGGGYDVYGGAVAAAHQDVRGGEDACEGADAVAAKGEGPIVQSTIENPALGQIVAFYKYQTTKQINQLRDMPGVPFWQRNYWEHIVRDATSLERIRKYISYNPARWAEDQLHPNASPNRFNRWKP